MDLQMPVMDGFQATKAIREELKLKTPIVACSAHSLVGERDKCLEMGMDEYVSKPYSEVQLLNVILEFWDEARSPGTVKQTPEENIDEIIRASIEEEGADLIHALINILINRAPNDIQLIEAAIKAKDLQALSKRSHLLAGSLASLRFEQGYELAKQTERAALASDITKASKLGQQLIDYLNFVTTSLPITP